jgi:hypothetical protein
MVRESNQLHPLFEYATNRTGVFAIQYKWEKNGEFEKTYKFVLASNIEFWERFMSERGCTGCEVIRENSNCHLYIDIDVNLCETPGIQARVCWESVEPVIRFICENRFPGKTIEYVLMDSNNHKKSSMHIVVKIEGHIFKSGAHCGAFMRCLQHLIETDYQSLQGAFSFFDMGVYTKNRLFRMLGCTKIDENRPLTDGVALTYDRWMRSRICPLEHDLKVIEMLEKTGEEPKYTNTRGGISSFSTSGIIPPCVHEAVKFLSTILPITRVVSIPWVFKFCCNTDVKDCRFQQRRHKSNVQYLVLDLMTKTYVIRCRSHHCKELKSDRFNLCPEICELIDKWLNTTISSS